MTRISTTNRRKVINSQKQSGFFWPTLYVPVRCHLLLLVVAQVFHDIGEERIVSQDSIVRGRFLGKGAFGAVYAGSMIDKVLHCFLHTFYCKCSSFLWQPVTVARWVGLMTETELVCALCILRC